MGSTPLTAQECYLLERYTSLDYYGKVRDAWESAVRHVETLFDQYMHHLPDGYRKRPLPKQPDAVWGEMVLPNFQSTLQRMYKNYIRFSHGDWNVYGGAGITTDARGQSEFWAGWMDEVRPGATDEYYDLIHAASFLARKMSATARASWIKGALSTRYTFTDLDPWTPPSAWPAYRLNPSIRVKTGERVTQPGIYWPEAEDSAVQFFPPSIDTPDLTRFLAKRACAGLIREGGMRSERREPTTWIKVERVPGETVNDGLADLLSDRHQRRQHNVAGGQPCPREGWWFTPAEAGGKSHYFKSGEIFPVIEDSQYGDTFWQWTQDQET